ncbi:MAG: hypothetical protein OQK73_04580 [Gammaproteobacteria bacterium]|nr:hypothetical protein [Gammaproteobacteria bacterium]
MSSMLFKAIGIWLVIVVAAILNGMFRENVLEPAIGESMALSLSGILLAVLVFLVTLILVSFIGSSESEIYIWVGFLWVVLTLSFEFLFGHFVAGKSWQEIMQVFNIKKGDLFIVVLFVTAISPWLTAKLRGIL